MKVIQMKDILALYKTLQINPSVDSIRTTINTGSLSRNVNTGTLPKNVHTGVTKTSITKQKETIYPSFHK